MAAVVIVIAAVGAHGRKTPAFDATSRAIHDSLQGVDRVLAVNPDPAFLHIGRRKLLGAEPHPGAPLACHPPLAYRTGLLVAPIFAAEAAQDIFGSQCGEPGWDRTNDHLIKSQMLYR